MNDLQTYFHNNEARYIAKWEHYFEVYDRYFSKYRNQEVNILEIGLWQGGSLQMWQHYFGPKARIFGIDIDPRCKTFEEQNVQVFIGSQSDRVFLRDVRARLPKLDILIDDGGHSMKQQITTFEELFDQVKDDGIYLCEDVHTSYWPEYNGGYKRRGTFIEHSKNFVDWLNAYHSRQKGLKPNRFTTSAHAVHYYDSIVLIEKRLRLQKPYFEQRGSIGFENFADRPPRKTMLQKLRTFYESHR